MRFYNWIPGRGEPNKEFGSLRQATEEASRLAAVEKTSVITLQILALTKPPCEHDYACMKCGHNRES